MATDQPTLSTYRGEPGRYDELADESSAPRSHWASLVSSFGRLGENEIARRQSLAERLLVSEGAGHGLHDDERRWQLDPIPLVIAGAEWRTLSAGLVQRASLLEAIADDLYGSQKLIKDQIIPAAILASRRFQMACRFPINGPRLTRVATDVVRDATGRLIVLRDHTDAPEGSGDALLYRSVLTRLFPDVHRAIRVTNHAPWFGKLRDALGALAPPDRSNPRTVVLTPGPQDPSYIEHSYLSAHLGYNLVEGADLIMRERRIWLRALGGLEPIDVILRRVRDRAADPLDLPPGGPGAVAGLLQAVRLGAVGLANTLGTGLIESIVLHPFLDRACEHLLGERLRLRSVDTLWCGDPEQLALVRSDPSSFVLHDTDPLERRPSVFGDRLTEPELETWLADIEREPHRYVAQRKVMLASTPVMLDGRLRAGAVALRLHVVRTATDAAVLPGGHARVLDPETPIVNQASAAGKDIWVLDDAASTGRIRTTTDRGPLPQIDLRQSLPSRAAETLYWVGRNAERAETSSRVARVVANKVISDPGLMELSGGEWVDRSIGALRVVSGRLGAQTAPPGQATDARLADEITAAMGNRAGAVGDSLRHLISGAASVREFLSTATWRVIGALDSERTRLSAGVTDELSRLETLDRIIISLSAFAGLSLESVVRGPGWRFLDLGRRVERAIDTLGLVDTLLTTTPTTEVVQSVYETLLASCESLVAYRRRHRSDLMIDAVTQMVLADDANPRSVAFQLDRIGEHIAALPSASTATTMSLSVERAALALVTLSTTRIRSQPGLQVDALMDVVLAVRGDVLTLAEQIAQAWFAPQDPARRQGSR